MTKYHIILGKKQKVKLFQNDKEQLEEIKSNSSQKFMTHIIDPESAQTTRQTNAKKINK